MTTRDNRRAFGATQKSEILFQQNNKCAICHKPLDPRAIEYDHVKAWSWSGRTVTQNGAALCPTCHRIKTHHDRLKVIDKPKKKKPLSKEDLNKLTPTQLKFLANKHNIKVKGTTYNEYVFGVKVGSQTYPPTKLKYVNELFGKVLEGEKFQ